ncbi:hypothetical protein ACNF49_18590 [Actinomadura sp. ATCC 39365]|uniref:hypothetical protein n=1 Tax=Nonomuraea sp. NPDC005692 TaxID=3157168 RepID=UPI0033D16D45
MNRRRSWWPPEGWAPRCAHGGYLPKECLPVEGTPGIVRLLDEIAVLGEARVRP